MRVLGIDPGNVQSAWLLLSGGRPITFGLVPNAEVLAALREGVLGGDVVVIEQVESFGMAVGRTVFETVHWAGRFTEAAEHRGTLVVQLPRRIVKVHLCHSNRAKDGNVIQALKDKFGGDAAVGRKASPGPLYGISRDVWSALAIAVTYDETEGVL